MLARWKALQEKELQEGLCGHVSSSDREGKGNGAARKGESEAARLINRLVSLPSETSLNVTEGRALSI